MFGLLESELDALFAQDPSSCGDEDLNAAIVAGREFVERARAFVTELTAEWEQRGLWVKTGAKSPAACLAHMCRSNRTKAAAELRDVRLLRSMPLTRRAVHNGEITLDHVRALGRVCNRRTHDAFVRDEKILVDAARTAQWDSFTRIVDYWHQHADPDGTDLAAEERRAKRQFSISESLGGDVYGNFRLDPIGGATFRGVHEAIERELFEADWADARRRKGDAAMLADIVRTPQQRRADALVEMAVRAATAPKDGKRPAPLFVVLVGYETFAGRILELANGTVVTPGAVAPWLSESYIERAVFDGPSAVIDLGRRRRFFRGAARHAIEIRDRHCQGFACSTPAHRCDVDHVQEWDAGGATDHANGELRCPWHHRHKNGHPPPDDPDG